MRKVIYSINVSTDGCCDHTKMQAGEDVHDYFTQLLLEGDTYVYGRVTYELMVPFWPDIARDKSGPTRSMNDFAQAFNTVKKIVVFSKTLTKAADERTHIVRGGLKEEILKLKQEPGKSIMVGGVDIPEQLTKLGLIDEYIFVVQPVVVGEGRRIGSAVKLTEALQLKLIESKVLPSGTMVLRYAKV